MSCKVSSSLARQSPMNLLVLHAYVFMFLPQLELSFLSLFSLFLFPPVFVFLLLCSCRIYSLHCDGSAVSPVSPIKKPEFWIGRYGHTCCCCFLLFSFFTSIHSFIIKIVKNWLTPFIALKKYTLLRNIFWLVRWTRLGEALNRVISELLQFVKTLTLR